MNSYRDCSGNADTFSVFGRLGLVLGGGLARLLGRRILAGRSRLMLMPVVMVMLMLVLMPVLMLVAAIVEGLERLGKLFAADRLVGDLGGGNDVLDHLLLEDR